jgi:hypothetical protein
MNPASRDPILEKLTGCSESILEGLAACECKAFQRHCNSKEEINTTAELDRLVAAIKQEYRILT